MSQVDCEKRRHIKERTSYRGRERETSRQDMCERDRAMLELHKKRLHKYFTTRISLLQQNTSTKYDLSDMSILKYVYGLKRRGRPSSQGFSCSTTRLRFQQILMVEKIIVWRSSTSERTPATMHTAFRKSTENGTALLSHLVSGPSSCLRLRAARREKQKKNVNFIKIHGK